MNTKKILALLLSVVMLIGVLGACGSKTDSEEENTDKTAEETTGETEETAEGFNMAVNIASEPKSIDPALNKAVDGAIMLNHFFEGLLKWDKAEGEAVDGLNAAKLVNGQAKDYEKVVNEDGTVTYTFTLRDDAKWSDGESVDAQDFVYTWQRLATPETAASYNYMIDMVVGYDEVADGTAEPSTLGVEATDDRTFVVNLKNDCPYFLEICAFPATYPVRKDIIEANGDQWTFEPETYVSNGPYKMSEWVHNSYIETVKNEEYYDVDNLGPDSITYKLMDDENAIYSGFTSGELQFVNRVPTDEFATLLANGDLDIASQFGTYYACFNVEQAPFDDPLVRKAFSLAVDRNFIVEQVTQGGQLPASGFVPSGIYDAEGPEGDDFRTVGKDYYSVAKEDYEANCEEARKLLEEAGYPNGEGFPAVEYLYNTDDEHKAVAEALQSMWKEQLGVDVTLNNQEWAVFIQTRQNGNYQIARNGWLADYNDPCNFLDMWYTDGGNNDAQYSNPDYDAAIDAAKATIDPAERMKAFHEAEDLLIGEEHALLPIYFYTQKYMLDDNVEGTYYSPYGYFFFGKCTQTEAE